ncbi:MAG: hypothetical protein NVS9B14_20590 [Candidatus Acidiferrum sp.]
MVEAGATFGVRQSDTGQAEFGGFGEKVAGEMAGLVVFTGARLYFRFGKFANGFLEEELVVGESEVHAQSTQITEQCNAGDA